MINSVYKTVLALLNKNNYGNVSPADFNLYAKQAQMDIFNNYFRNFNQQVNLENLRRSGEGMANISKKISEDIENFSVTSALTKLTANTFSLPSLTTTGSVAFMIEKVVFYVRYIAAGNITSASATQLIVSSADFIGAGVQPGWLVINRSTLAVAKVTSVVSATTLALSTTGTFSAFPAGYAIYAPLEAEKLSHNKSTLINTSLYTKPSVVFPAYTTQGTTLTAYPLVIPTYTDYYAGMVEAQYYRYPLDPKWTYVSLTGGAPSFDQSQTDYQDFEVPADEEINLVIKICQYCGIEIREQQVVEFAKREQMENDQPKG